MSAFRDLAQGALARNVGALTSNRSGSPAAPPTRGHIEAPAVAPGTVEHSEQDLRDRERELRILMSNWM
jgi:hypothetical protein